jgi:hypothetical protein
MIATTSDTHGRVKMKKTATTAMAASGAMLLLASAAQAEGEINALV